MRIVTRDEFLKLPKGTLFAKFQPNVFDDYCIKDETIGDIDFFYSPLWPQLDTEDSNQTDLMLDELINDPNLSKPVVYNNLFRDGCFDEDQLFAVFDASDVKALISELQSTIAE